MSSTLPAIEGETTGRAQTVRPRYNWESEHVSQNTSAHAESSAHRCARRRALVEMQRKVVKRGKRSKVFRFVLAKDDKDKIAAWKQDLVRILQVFNVRPVNVTGDS